MPSVSGECLHGLLNLGHVSWADGSLCERLADERPAVLGIGLVKVLKRSLTCVRVLPGFGVTTAALAWTSCRSPYRRIRVPAPTERDEAGSRLQRPGGRAEPRSPRLRQWRVRGDLRSGMNQAEWPRGDGRGSANR